MVKIPKWYVEGVLKKHGERVIFERLVKLFRKATKKPALDDPLDETLRLQIVFEKKEKLNTLQKEKLKELLKKGLRRDETLGD